MDKQLFVPSSTDPLLASGSLAWLGDAVVLAHEIRARDLEKTIQSSRLEERLRRVRLRMCERISLSVGGADDPENTSESTTVYAHEDEVNPTLLVARPRELTWEDLSDLGAPLSILLDRRLKSLELLLSKLAVHTTTAEVTEPSEAAYARALDCDIAIVQEHLASTRSGQERLLRLILPAVACILGSDAAKRLQHEAGEPRSPFSLRTWLETQLPDDGPTTDDVLKAARTGDSGFMRRALGLDFERFNRCLEEFGATPITNAAELRAVFDAYLTDVRQDLRDRARRAHYAEFRAGRSLAGYLVDRSLSFVTFDEAWISTREHLDRHTAIAHIQGQADARLGNILPLGPTVSLDRTRRENQRQVERTSGALTTLVVAWCGRKSVTPPSVWTSGEPLGLVRALDLVGLIDFDLLTDGEVPLACQKAGVWPPGMAPHADLAKHGLSESDLSQEANRIKAEREAAAIAARSVRFCWSGSRYRGSPLCVAVCRACRDADAFRRANELAQSPGAAESLRRAGGCASTRCGWPGRQEAGEGAYVRRHARCRWCCGRVACLPLARRDAPSWPLRPG